MKIESREGLQEKFRQVLHDFFNYEKWVVGVGKSFEIPAPNSHSLEFSLAFVCKIGRRHWQPTLGFVHMKVQLWAQTEVNNLVHTHII